MHNQAGTATEIGSCDITLRDLLKGKLVSTAQSDVRVFDSYNPVSEGGFVRTILYLEDVGEVEASAKPLPAEVTALRYQQKQGENADPNAPSGDLEK
jgi:hypothetical protein